MNEMNGERADVGQKAAAERLYEVCNKMGAWLTELAKNAERAGEIAEVENLRAQAAHIAEALTEYEEARCGW